MKPIDVVKRERDEAIALVAELQNQIRSMRDGHSKTAEVLGQWQTFAATLGKRLQCCGITDDILDAVDKLKADNAQLEALLLRYAAHEVGCGWYEAVKDMPPLIPWHQALEHCTCGLSAWKGGTTPPTPEMDKLRAENEQLAAAIAVMHVHSPYPDCKCELCAATRTALNNLLAPLQKEKAQLAAAFYRLSLCIPLPLAIAEEIKAGKTDEALLSAIERQLRSFHEVRETEAARLRAENAQLAAAIAKARTAYDRLYAFHGTPNAPPNLACDQKECDWCDVSSALDAPTAALAALLAPTIELLTAYPTSIHEYDSEYSRKVMEELARLRAVTGDKT